MRLSRTHAKKQFEQGYPVQLRSSRSGYAPYGWNSAALRHFGLATFDEFEAAAQARLQDGGGSWHGAPPSRKTYDVAAGHIFRREPFKIGNLQGALLEQERDLLNVGDLPEKYELALRADLRDMPPVFIVWSYSTVIAWRRKNGHAWDDPDKGGVTVPPVRYSLTTTQHQHVVARALGLDGFMSSESAREGKGKTPYTKGWQSR